ncbi:hypothetical protein Pyn_38032 [Prunus yedoensis var. nudiflora]|uniref:Transposase MuDR plant domain-containing protein n=1 Tax=Prunus yedoensis var. nudiflora TaxID=2094558 RepID=A0A314UMP1_PRUYE|nr:hypothetical protein Pyn_38032 [Prunus yedoensis var. nudiflora]
MNSASSKGKEKVAEVDEGCVQHETKKANSKGKKKVIEVDEGKWKPSIEQQADKNSSKNDDESDPNFVNNEYDGEWGGLNADQSVPKPSNVGDFVDNEDMFAMSEEDEQNLRKAPQLDEDSTGHTFPKFNTSCDIGIVKFDVGMQFANSVSFRNALKAISIKEGWEICWMKSEKYRIRAICASENYPF